MKAALESLLSEVRACTICRAALPHGVRPIVQADNAARVLIAGQAPVRLGTCRRDPSVRLPGANRC